MSRFQISWEIAKRSWAVLKSDKTLAWFPVLLASSPRSWSSASSAGLIASMAGIDNKATGDSLQPLGWVIIVVALPRAGDGADLLPRRPRRRRRPAPPRAGTPRVRTALDVANSRLHRLLPWAVVTATVTLILQAIEERFGHRRQRSSARSSAWRGTWSRSSSSRSSCSRTSAWATRSKRSKDLLKTHLGRERHRPGRPRRSSASLPCSPACCSSRIGVALGTARPHRARCDRRGRGSSWRR